MLHHPVGPEERERGVHHRQPHVLAASVVGSLASQQRGRDGVRGDVGGDLVDDGVADQRRFAGRRVGLQRGHADSAWTT